MPDDGLVNIGFDPTETIHIINNPTLDQYKSTFNRVGIVRGIADNNNLYTGLCFKTTCNVGFCAETSVIAQMLLKGETRITKLVAVYNGNEIVSPCGKCREQIYQLNHDNINCEILLNDKVMLLKDLLPEL